MKMRTVVLLFAVACAALLTPAPAAACPPCSQGPGQWTAQPCVTYNCSFCGFCSYCCGRLHIGCGYCDAALAAGGPEGLAAFSLPSPVGSEMDRADIAALFEQSSTPISAACR